MGLLVARTKEQMVEQLVPWQEVRAVGMAVVKALKWTVHVADTWSTLIPVETRASKVIGASAKEWNVNIHNKIGCKFNFIN